MKAGENSRGKTPAAGKPCRGFAVDIFRYFMTMYKQWRVSSSMNKR